MIHTYKISGMHCASCVGRVQQALEGVEGVKKAIVSLTPPEAVVNMSHHLDTATLNRAVATTGAYSLTNEVAVINTMSATHEVSKPPVSQDEATTALSATTYKPLLLILVYLLGITVLAEVRSGGFNWMRAMSTFMAGFFLTFSFFKLLDIPGFASTYRMYDIVAKAMPGYGFVYPFIELALGIAYLSGWNPWITNAATLVVMGVSLIGVIQSVVNKRQIQCACLGAVFNLPMSTVTIFEDSLMMGMAGIMLWVM